MTYNAFETPTGMTRRHFAQHLVGASAMVGTAMSMGHAIAANAESMRKNRKAAILLWMSGGPATIDLWDLKPGATTGGPFKAMLPMSSGSRRASAAS